MRAALRLELFGDDLRSFERGLPKELRDLLLDPAGEGYEPPLRPWVARIAGLHIGHGTFKREFVRGHKDYRRANGIGSRGVMMWYTLEPGIYEVNEQVSWRRWERYFLRVDEQGSMHRIEREEVIACLRNAISA